MTASGELVITADGGQTLPFEATWPILDVTDLAGNNLTHIDFASVAVGETASALLFVGNQGSEPLMGEAVSDDGSFTITGSPYEVADPSSPAVVEIIFSPAAEGEHEGYVTFDGGGSVELYVSGTATASTGCSASRIPWPALLLFPFWWRRRRGQPE